MFKEECITYNMLLQSTKTKYYKSLIDDADQTKLFKMIGQMFITKRSTPLPVHDSLVSLVEEFNNYFITKIENLRSSLQSTVAPQLNAIVEEKCSSSFTVFKPVLVETVDTIIMESPTKSCQLDPIPTKFIKECKVLSPIITNIANYSL
jgi:hypothetical protein